MRDLDSAVGRLDNILMSVYFVVAVLIVAVALVRVEPEMLTCDLLTTIPQEAQLLTIVTGAGTLVLGKFTISKSSIFPWLMYI